jgi:short-subunit dehydrogenase
LKQRGYSLILVARRKDRLLSLARELGENPASARAIDLSVAGASRTLASELERESIQIDLLVNNAGVGHTARFDEQPPERIAAMLQLNVCAVVEMTHAFVPAMVRRGRGHVINVASNAAFQPVPFLSVYAATKSFVVSFTEGIAAELRGTGVAFQALCPGLTATEFLEVAETHTGNLLVRKLPTMRAEEVAAASLRGLDRGRLRVVPGFANRALATLQGFLPRAVARSVAGALYRPPGG